MAVGILTVGAVGIMSMHQASTMGNMYARQMTTANQVNQLWLERLRRDAIQWNAPGPTGLVGTQYLRATPVGEDPSGWFTPEGNLDVAEFFAFDFYGNDTQDNEAMRFCTNVQLRFTDATATTIRVDVRTWWHRRIRGRDGAAANASLYDGCAQGNEAAIDTELLAVPSRLHAVYGATVVRWRSAS